MVIVVDPVRHETAAAADLHLQLRPGSDAALAFALLHVLRRDGLLDHGYIEFPSYQLDTFVDFPHW